MFAQVITNGELWLEILDKRNIMSHTYNETIFIDVVNKIKNEYFSEIEKLYQFFKKENEK